MVSVYYWRTTQNWDGPPNHQSWVVRWGDPGFCFFRSTETRFCPQTDGPTDRHTDGRRETSITPFQLCWNGGIIKFNGLSWTADSEVHVIHISCLIITYTLEWLSSLTQITNNLQVTINCKMKLLQNTKNWEQPLSWLATGDTNSTFSLQDLTNSMDRTTYCHNNPSRRK